MFLNHIISWGMVAMLSSLTMTTGSVDRNSTSSQNNNPASVEEVNEGCAANFVCPLGTEPFYYDHLDFEESNVEDVTKWKFGYAPNNDCGGIIRACLICVDVDFIEESEMTINTNFVIETEPTLPNVVRVTSSPSTSNFDFQNKS